MGGIGALAASFDVHASQVSAGVNLSRIKTYNAHGKLRWVESLHTVVTAAAGVVGSGTGTLQALVDTDELNIVQLPAGAKMIIPMCLIKFSDSAGATTTIDIGWRAYTQNDGTAIAEDADGIINGWDAATTALELWATSTVAFGAGVPLITPMQTIAFDSKGPVTIFMTCNDAAGTYAGDVGDLMHFGIAYVTD